MNETIKEITIINDPLLALILDACCETKSARTPIPGITWKQECYVYSSTPELKRALNAYKAGELGTNVSAAYLLAYRDNDGWGK